MTTVIDCQSPGPYRVIGTRPIGQIKCPDCGKMVPMFRDPYKPSQIKPWHCPYCGARGDKHEARTDRPQRSGPNDPR